MVSQLKRYPLPNGAELDIEQWLTVAADQSPLLATERLAPVLELICARGAPDAIEFSLQLAELAVELQLDTSAVAGALCYRPVRVGDLELAGCAVVLDADAQHLLQLMLRMAQVQLLKLQSSKLQTAVASDQLQNVQHMVTALIDGALGLALGFATIPVVQNVLAPAFRSLTGKGKEDAAH